MPRKERFPDPEMRLRHVRAIVDEEEEVEAAAEVTDTGLGLQQRNVRVRFRDYVVVGM